MDYLQIEKKARLLQFDIWSERQILFPSGAPLLRMFSPDVAARVLGVEYESRASIAAADSRFRAAGQLDRGRGIISVSSEFPFEVQRFTGAHEIGHLLLHPEIGDGVAHRDLPIVSGPNGRTRPVWEQEADYFAACFLAPRKLFLEAFECRFGPAPLYLDDNVAFYLAGRQGRLLATEPPGSMQFGIAVAKAEWLGGPRFKSLAATFGMSPAAVAIRLRELGLLAA